MKKFMNLLLAAILGSALTVGATFLLGTKDNIVKIEHVTASQNRLTSNGMGVQTDFTSAAELVMPAVVHIQVKAAISNRNYSQSTDPFQNFFGGAKKIIRSFVKR